MRADFAALFEHVDVFGQNRRGAAGLLIGFSELREAQRAGKTGWAGAGDENIRVESFAFDRHENIVTMAGRQRKTGERMRRGAGRSFVAQASACASVQCQHAPKRDSEKMFAISAGTA